MNSQWDVIEDGVVEVSGSRIAKVCSSSEIEIPRDAQVVDASQRIVMPGLVNAHMHLGMGLLRGLAEDLPLSRWLQEVIFPVEKTFGSHEFVYLGAKLSCLELVRNGVTCVTDMYHFEEAAAEAVTEVGLRAICAQDISDLVWEGEVSGTVSKRVERFLERVRDFPRVTPALGPHAIYTVNETLMKDIVSFASEHNLLVHMHVSESEQEVLDCVEKTGKRPIEYLDSLEFFQNRSVLAHGTWLNDEEISFLSKHQVGIAHNIESNLKLRNRVCPVAKLREAGVPVALGTDSVTSNNDLDLLTEADMAAKLQTHREGIGRVPTREWVKMLTREGARALGLEQEIGSLEVGKQADIITVDTSVPNAQPLYDPYIHLVYSARGADVREVFVAGRQLLGAGNFLHVDAPQFYAGLRPWVDRLRLWKPTASIRY